MKRRDLFRKILTKSIDISIEKGEEAIEIFKEYTNPELVTEDKLAPESSKYKVTAESSSDELKNTHTSNEKANFKHSKLPFPPGSVNPEEKFLKKCTGCGDCVFNCPYTAIFPVYNDKLGKNIPHLDTNSNACMMCEDWPCINSCNFGALKPLKINEKPKLGQAKGIFDYCINHHTEEMTCNACQEACPIEKTVFFRKNKPNFAKSCTGCGLCVQSCPTFPKAIRIS
ncbi:MAG: 4Fe-4S dicluster domain-containing protein [Leptospira sp.]|nr:4Fe-4S dicluster domain-containing protein [Leptospira sp.]